MKNIFIILSLLLSIDYTYSKGDEDLLSANINLLSDQKTGVEEVLLSVKEEERMLTFTPEYTIFGTFQIQATIDCIGKGDLICCKREVKEILISVRRVDTDGTETAR